MYMLPFSSISRRSLILLFDLFYPSPVLLAKLTAFLYTCAKHTVGVCTYQEYGYLRIYLMVMGELRQGATAQEL